MRYKFIASSISDLEMQQFGRGVNMINNDIIASIEARREYEQAYGETGLMHAYNPKNSDLQDERRHAQLLGQHIFSELIVEVDAQEAKNDKNVSKMDPVTDNSEPHYNICHRISPD